MAIDFSIINQLQHENADLRTRLKEVEEILGAIRSGKVDALVVSTEGGEQIFTLEGADHSFRVLIEEMSEGALIITEAGDTLYANQRFAEMLRRPLEKVIGSSLIDWIKPADRKYFFKALLREDGKRRLVGLDIVDRGGALIPSQLSLIDLEEGDLQDNIAVVVADLTERNLVEDTINAERLTRVKMEELRKREEQLRTLAENVPGILQRFDRQLRVVWLSPAAEKVLGISVEKFIGKTNREMGMPEHLCNLWETAMNEVLDTGQPREVEFAFESVDGPKSFILRLAPEFSADGKAEFILGLATDITDRKKAEELLRESQEQLAAELEASQLLQDLSIQMIQAGNVEALYDKLLSTFIKVMHADFAIIQQLHPERGKVGELYLLRDYGFGEFDTKCWEWITPQTKSSCGLALKSLQRVSFSDVLQCDYMAGGDILEQYRQAGIRAVQSTPLISRTGTVLGIVSTHWREPHDLTESEQRNLDVLARQAADLIERSLAEEALLTANEGLREADMRKDEFLGALSHEIRNPLASITLGLSLLERVVQNGEKAKQAREIMARQVAQLSHLVDDLLDVTRITRNLITLKLEQVELNGLIYRAANDYQEMFYEKGVELIVLPELTDLYVEADLTRLSQVLGNLFHNSLKFTKAGGFCRVSVSLDDLKESAVIRVEDNGMGMTSKMIKSLFKPFMQADESLDRSQGGLGLGLALVKGLVELHGGKVEAYSKGLGEGAVFTIYLPLSVKPSPVRKDEIISKSQCQKLRVLVIEDIKDVAEVIKLLLVEDGHEVKVASDGINGINMAKDYRPDVVLCDIGLPGMDGYQVARALCSCEELQGTLLVSLTGYARPVDIQHAIEAGFHCQLAKPISLEELRKALSRGSDEVSGT
jgi:PAS domain S-box-containing protein